MKRTKYTPMKGADFTNEPALVDNDRAPICENIIPDHAGYPEKRPGWRVENEYEGKIYGLHKYTFGGVTKMLVHEGKRLWCEDTLLCEDMAENISRSYQNDDDLIILDGQNYRVYSDGTLKKMGWNDTVDNLKSGDKYTNGGAYIPTTSISNTIAQYDKSTTAGVAYEKVNKLSKWRRMTAVGIDTNVYKKVTLDDDYCGEVIGDAITFDDGLGVWKIKETQAFIFINGIKYNVVAFVDEKDEICKPKYYT